MNEQKFELLHHQTVPTMRALFLCLVVSFTCLMTYGVDLSLCRGSVPSSIGRRRLQVSHIYRIGEERESWDIKIGDHYPIVDGIRPGYTGPVNPNIHVGSWIMSIDGVDLRGQDLFATLQILRASRLPINVTVCDQVLPQSILGYDNVFNVTLLRKVTGKSYDNISSSLKSCRLFMCIYIHIVYLSIDICIIFVYYQDLEPLLGE
jgi:hypothetical protein